MAFIDVSIVRDKRNEIFSEVEKVWKLIEEAIGEKGFPDIVYTMRDGDKIPDKNKGQPWARVSMNLTSAKATAISQRRYTNYGVFAFEVFVRTDATNAGSKVELLADYIKQYFRMYRGNVLLKNIAIQSRPNEAGYSSAVITADFEYQEFTERGVSKPPTQNPVDDTLNKSDLIYNDKYSPLATDTDALLRV